MSQFAGRLSVTIESEPQQHISGEFELEGDAQTGELRLYGPVVGLVAVIQWEPGRAVLIEGDRKRVVKSLDWLIERVTGAPIPVSMVFDWLNQRPVASNDWWVEPRLKPTDRFRAVRLQPLPRMELLMVLKKAAP
ncbi:MAG: lipoprotein insertase outer membrane protein LolB [Alphaproteobacteria bacterium]|nr:lipoprotein insertase outer membrane protein LolB [Alphaproteobacteria bacterium]